MSISLYISNTKVQVLEGSMKGKKISVSREISAAAPIDCMMDGVISDEVLFTEFLKNLWEENHLPTKDINLVLYCKTMVVAQVSIPKANEKNSYEYVKREFNKYEDETEQIYGYVPIEVKSKEKIMSALASKMERSEMETYIRVCTNAGLKLATISSALNGLISILHGLDEVKGNTCIIQVSEGQYLTNMLFLNGVFHYSSMTRIFEEHGSIGYAVEVARSVSKILQFMKANDLEYTQMQVFPRGLEREDIASCSDSIIQMNNELEIEDIEVTNLVQNQTDKDPQSFLYAASGLQQIPKTSNLLAVVKKSSKKEKQNNQFQKTIRPIIILTAVLALITLALGVMNILENRQLKSTQAYNDSMAALAANYDTLLQEASAMERQEKAVSQLKSSIDSYPVADSQIEQLIEQAAGTGVNATIDSFDAASGALDINTSSANVENINGFIEQLEEQDVFQSVNYTGYSFDDTDNVWKINVICYLATGAGRGNNE